MAGRTLHVRCASWEQVDIFTTRKLRRGKLLSMKVPFGARTGLAVTLGLELPNGIVVAIEGVVQKAAPVDGDASRTWIEIELSGYTDEVKARVEGMRREAMAPEHAEPQPAPALKPRRASSVVGDELKTDERKLFQHLTAELRRLRQAAVHEVLGVPPNAGPEVVRAAWKDLIRQLHPDLVARRNAPAISHLAEELTILANRAYDRMRSSLVAEGRAAIAGPRVASPPGWLVAFEDIKSDPVGHTPPRGTPRRFERPASPIPEPPPSPPSAAGQGSEAFEGRARAMLALGDANTAREVLAAALVVYPRSKPLRSLYYVATALAAVQNGELMLATAQLETALAHHEHCIEASKMLDHLRHGSGDPDAMRRLFR